MGKVYKERAGEHNDQNCGKNNLFAVLLFIEKSQRN